MAKRRTKEQINADKIIKEKLNILGQKIYEEAKANSRVDTGVLRDSVNFMVKPDTVLTVVQANYGKYQQPDELQEAIGRNLKEAIDLVVLEITEVFVENFTDDKIE